MTLIQEVERRQRRAGGAPVGTSITPGQAIFFMVFGLSVVHIILVVLVRSQYGQDVSFRPVLRDSVASIPIMTGLLYIFHPLRSIARQLVAFCLAVIIGCYLVYAANEEGYYASMQRAPPLGTLWVCLFLEIEWYLGSLCLLVVSVYTWTSGYHF